MVKDILQIIIIIIQIIRKLKNFVSYRPEKARSGVTGAVKTTIMDKSLGTVVQFKLYPRATNTLRPYPIPPPHRQC